MSPRKNDILNDIFDDAYALRQEIRRSGLPGRDPITLGIASIVTAIEAGAAAVGLGTAAGIGGGAAVATGLGGAIGGAAAVGIGTGISFGWAGGLALSVGLSYAANAIQRASMKDKGNLNAGINTPEQRLNVRQEVPPRRRVYGTPLVGGALFFEDSVAPWYYRGFLLSDGPVDGIEEFYNSQTRINLDPTGSFSLTPPYFERIHVNFRNGSRDQATDGVLLAQFPDLGANFRQRGIATLVFKGHYGVTPEEREAMWGSIGRPNPYVKLRGVRVYDPRDPTQLRPTDDDDAEALEVKKLTWKHSRNASLIQADYLWWKNGGRIRLDRLRWDEIAESANWDDGLIETKSGELITRHTIDGVVTAGQAPLQVLTTMLSANRGFIARRGGHVSVISSQPQEPRVTITDDWILSGFELRRTTPKGDTLNKLRAHMIDPRQEWQMVAGPVLVNEDYIEADGDTYEGSVQFPWTERHERAQRLQKAAMEDTRRGRMVTLSVDHRAIGIEAGDVVRFYSEISPRARGIYRVQEVQFNYATKSFEIAMVEYDKTVETNWTVDDEQDYELPDLEAA